MADKIVIYNTTNNPIYSYSTNIPESEKELVELQGVNAKQIIEGAPNKTIVKLPSLPVNYFIRNVEREP